MAFPPPSRVLALAFLSALLLLAGCGKFFPANDTGSGGSGSSTGDYLYVGSLSSGSPEVTGYSVSSSGITAISGAPWTLSVGPYALAINPTNKFLYVGGGAAYDTVDSLGIDSSTGSLSSITALGSLGPVALTVDKNGNWLVGLDGLLGEVYAFSLDSSGDIGTPYSSSVVPLSNCVPSTDLAGLPGGIAISSSDYVYVSCGTQGIDVLSLNSSSGALSLLETVGPKKTAAADTGLAIATTTAGSYLIAAESVTNGVRVFSISSTTGKLTELSSSPFSTGAGPDAVLVDATDSYVYVANHTDGTISGFLLSSSGSLTTISGSPFSTGSLPTAMAEDNSDTYIAVACEGSNALETYTISSTTAGALTSYKNFTITAPITLVTTH